MPLCLDMFLCFILTCHQFGLQRTKSSRGVQWREARACRCFRARRFITLPLLEKVTYRKEQWRALPPFSSRVIPISLHNERIVNSLTSLIRQQELHDVMLTQRNTQAMSHSLSDWAFYRFALFTEESAITNSISKIVLVDNIGHPLLLVEWCDDCASFQKPRNFQSMALKRFLSDYLQSLWMSCKN